MACGLSGSNGGVRDGNNFFKIDLLKRPLEVSFFVNNICNLKCKHCYVGYNKKEDELTVEEWIKIFDKLIEMNALTFGNVGKEPLLSSEKTFKLLKYFAEKRKENLKIRFGFVTNGTLLNSSIAKQLEEILPDYIDISLDGTQEVHDYIRGEGKFKITTENLKNFPKKLKKKVFISFTLMRSNKDSFKEMVKELDKMDFKKFIISPYIKTPDSDGELYLEKEEVVEFYKQIIEGKVINFSNLSEIEILLKVDYDSQKELMDLLCKKNIIDLKKLLIDEYGVLFNLYEINNSKIIINYIPFSDTFSRAIRISHDGYLSGCLEMFHEDYPIRARGNLREEKIQELLIN
ncbi:MAG: radical SAM protein [Nanoarchaeota archaeon]|nr:radical SAM protein [Nanoarchaeota archaeon]